MVDGRRREDPGLFSSKSPARSRGSHYLPLAGLNLTLARGVCGISPIDFSSGRSAAGCLIYASMTANIWKIETSLITFTFLCLIRNFHNILVYTIDLLVKGNLQKKKKQEYVVDVFLCNRHIIHICL